MDKENKLILYNGAIEGKTQSRDVAHYNLEGR